MQHDNVFLAIKMAVVAAGAAFGAAFGWLGWLVIIWAAAMVLDYITGSAAAMAKGAWASSVARAGIFHKGGMIAVVALSALADGLILQATNLPAIKFPWDYTMLLCPIVLIWYILTELGSVAENCTGMGAPVPTFVTRILAASTKAVDAATGADDSAPEENKNK